MEAMNMASLIQIVRQQAPAGPLERVEAAHSVAEELASGADDLIGIFVGEARDAGCSWTEIGHWLGVTKQAARQRFAVPSAPGEMSDRRRRRRGKSDFVPLLGCSFCGKRQSPCLRCVAGPGVLICEECVHLCTEILSAPTPV